MATLDQQYYALKRLVEWDRTIIAPRGGFNIRKLSRYLNKSEQDTKKILKNLHTHLADHVCDNDFCNYIKWCHPRYPFKHTGYEDFAGPGK